MKKKNIIIITSVLAALLIAIGIALYIYNLPENRANRAMDLAKSLIASENWEEAKIQLNKIIEIDETNLEAHIMLADVYMKQDDTDNAITVYKKIIELVPERAETYFDYAQIYINQEKWEGAIDILQLGVNNSGDKRIKDKLAEVEKKIAEIEEAIRKAKEEEERLANCKWYLVEEKGYLSDGSLNKRGWYKYEYDENGNMITSTCYKLDESVLGWQEYEYDKNGNMIMYTYFELDGTVWCRLEYEYDENGNNIRITNYDKDDVVSSVTEKEYDTNGNMVKEHYTMGWYTSPDDIYEYDEHNNLIKEISGDWVYSYEYDSDNNKIAESMSDAGSMSYRLEYEYDLYGKLVREKEYDKNDKLKRVTEYEYDENDNKIKQVWNDVLNREDDGEDVHSGWTDYKYEFR